MKKSNCIWLKLSHVKELTTCFLCVAFRLQRILKDLYEPSIEVQNSMENNYETAQPISFVKII